MPGGRTFRRKAPALIHAGFPTSSAERGILARMPRVLVIAKQVRRNERFGVTCVPQCTAGPPRMDHVRAYIRFSYIKYSRTSFIAFYYTTEVLNLRPYQTAILGGPVA
jgi:hypothetical protein